MNFPTIYTGERARLEADAMACFETANMQSAPAEKLATEGCDPAPTPAPTPAPRRFEVGAVYATRSLCDYECIFRWVVKRRTAKSVWLQSVGGPELKPYGDVTRRALSIHYAGEEEMCYPSGSYSMCPILTADKKETI